MNALEIFNECSILIVSYHLVAFTDFVPSVEAQYDMGFVLCGVTMLNIVVNLVCLVVYQVSMLISTIRRRRILKRVNA